MIRYQGPSRYAWHDWRPVSWFMTQPMVRGTDWRGVGRIGNGLSGYTPIALQAATGQWGGTPGQLWTQMWSPTALWQAYAPGSAPYTAARETLQAICGSNPGDPPLPAGSTFSAGGMTPQGIANQCNPPQAPNPGETGAAYRTRQMQYTASSMSPTDAAKYTAAATAQAAVSDAYAAAHPPGTPPAPVSPTVLSQIKSAAIAAGVPPSIVNYVAPPPTSVTSAAPAPSTSVFQSTGGGAGPGASPTNGSGPAAAGGVTTGGTPAPAGTGLSSTEWLLILGAGAALLFFMTRKH